MRYLIGLAMIGLVAAGCGPSRADTDAEPGAGAGAADRHDGHDAPGGQAAREEGRVAFSAQQVEAAGIRTVAVGPGRIETLLELSAVVDVNLDAQAHVNPRVGGLVRAIHARLGQAVRRGDPLCEIDSVDLGRAVGAFLGAQALLDASADILVRERALLARNLELAHEIFEREHDLAEREITTLSARYEAERALQEAQLRHDTRILELEARLAQQRIELVAAERELELLGLRHEDVTEIAAKAHEPHEPFGT
jgi:cobalt-zinc-cadmium efflux system membrane fusion protein